MVIRDCQSFQAVSDDIKTRLMDSAQCLLQTRGFNGFSYRDLSREVGIRTASIHYHFPTKTDLVVAVVQRYRNRVSNLLAGLADSSLSVPDRLDAAAKFFEETLSNGQRVCIAGALAGEYLSLPPLIQVELQRLIEDSQTGLVQVLSVEPSLNLRPRSVSSDSWARLWYSAVQGALLFSRAGHPHGLREVVETLRALVREDSDPQG